MARQSQTPTQSKTHLLGRTALTGLLAAALFLSACGQAVSPTDDLAAPPAPVTVTRLPLAMDSAACTDTFLPKDLDHITTTADGVIRAFESNGAGVAAGDLDDDGDLDLVLGSHAGPDTILWNEGGLGFRKESFGPGLTRSVAVVDVDGDGGLDIVLTRHSGAVNLWRNLGPDAAGPRFAPAFLSGVGSPAYAQDWADLDLDGDLDLVTASYDAALLNDLGNSFLMGGGGGVHVHTQAAGLFRTLSLAQSAQALVVNLVDVSGDGRLDILVGNDFAVPDMAWAGSLDKPADGWRPITPFAHTSYSTMSFDAGDVDNNGQLDLFATDMKPPDQSVETLSAWLPVVQELWSNHANDDPQRMENTLQLQTGPGRFDYGGYTRRIDATGWSWSGKFGDLDNDGFLDLYIVNGMAEERIFAHLPDHELVEANKAFRNDGDGAFLPVDTWGLGSLRSGRGMVMADLDGDGDLDIVVNNLRAPAQLFENRLCGGAGIEVDLRQSGTGNTHAIGAAVTLHTDRGEQLRAVRVASGYLSGDSSRLHFGVAKDAVISGLTIRWPDGAVSVVDGVAAGEMVTIVRGDR
ncbi:MAG: CRTAC1 family protein [Caldilineaceae bacterium]|nr:CRTAC1 family protein [Caldilineaceae bacterium]MBP8109440.1 CRTAC1 family protein [Caldilineaceae bacterium]MBP8124695.1 CRTAC1 family protein [Caldilineaceae bacterium]MBP9071689.1 CRTAC1 family protein [Caldilineaceae bacterium]